MKREMRFARLHGERHYVETTATSLSALRRILGAPPAMSKKSNPRSFKLAAAGGEPPV